MNAYRQYTIYTRQIGYVIGSEILFLLLNFILFPILTKGLGITLYGTWSLILATIALIVPFAGLGLSGATVRLLAGEKDRGIIRDDFLSMFSITFASGAAFSVALFLVSDYLAVSIFKDINSSLFIKVASALILLESISVLPGSLLRAFRKIGLSEVIKIFTQILRFSLIAAAIFLGYKLWGVITAVVIYTIISTLVTLFIVLRDTGVQLPRFSRIKAHLRYGVPLTPNSALMWIINVSDRYIISYFMGTAFTGIYSAAYALGYYASFLLGPLGWVLAPTVIKSYDEGNLGETRTYLKYSLRYFMMIAIPSAFGLSILAKPILQILTTPEFVPGSNVVLFVAFGAVLFAFYSICGTIIALTYKTELLVMLLGIAATLNIILNLILIPRMGIMGAAVATLVAYGVLGILTLIVTRKYLKFDISVPFMLKSVFSSAIMVLCIWLINPQSIALVIISILAGILIYFVVLLLIKGLSREEIAFFINFVKDNLSKIRMVK